MELFLPIKPRGKQSVRGTENNFYTPKQTKELMDFIGLYVQLEMRKLGIVTLARNIPVKASLVYYLEPPKSFTKTQRELALLKIILPTIKPDVDNVQKLIFDGMNKIFYYDDSQIVDVHVSKFYAEKEGIFMQLEEVKMHVKSNDDDFKNMLLRIDCCTEFKHITLHNESFSIAINTNFSYSNGKINLSNNFKKIFFCPFCGFDLKKKETENEK